MAVHSKAWAGINILIYGKKSLVPMQIEQTLAGITPANEVKLDSYEDYEDAYDFCKDNKKVGFFIILEECGDLDPGQVFSQLSKKYEESGWPAFGLLLYNENPTIKGLKVARDESRIIGYEDWNNLLDEKKVLNQFDSIWNQFIDEFESHIFPSSLRKTFLSLLSQDSDLVSYTFYSRIANLLSEGMNLSWLEITSLRWAHLINSIDKKIPHALKPHGSLQSVAGLSIFEHKTPKFIEIIKAKDIPLAQRTFATMTHLNQARSIGHLEEALNNISKLARPGAPAIIRNIAKKKARLIAIAIEEEAQSFEYILGKEDVG